MAKNRVELIISVDDKGSLKVVAKEADKAAKSVNKLSSATNNLTTLSDARATKQNRYNKLEKGTAQLTTNSTKAFSKQAQTIGSGIVPAYATLAANIFAITAAFGALQRAAQFEQLQAGLEYTGEVAGVSLTRVAEGLREITGAAVSTREAMSTVALGVSAGFSSEQLEGLTTVAKGASLALGRDMEDALSRLARGAAKLEPEILDELGIMVRLDDATETYAATLGKTAAELSQFERRQAFVNAIIEQGTTKFGDLAAEVEANPYDQLASAFKTLSTEGIKFINVFLGPLVKYLSVSGSALIGVLTLFGSTVVKKMIPSLEDMTGAARKAYEASAAMHGEQLKTISTLKGVSGSVVEYQKKLADGTATEKDRAKAVRYGTQSYESRRGFLKELIKEEGRFAAVTRAQAAQVANAQKAVNALAASTFNAAMAQQEFNAVQAISLVQQGHFTKGLKATFVVMQEQVAITKAGMAASRGWGIANIFLAGSFKIAATGARFLGATISRFLPYVGLVILGYSLIKDAISALIPEASALDKAFEKAEKQTEQFEATNKRLATTLANSTTTAASGFRATLTALAGEMRESAAEITDIVVQLQAELAVRIKKVQQEAAIARQIAITGTGPEAIGARFIAAARDDEAKNADVGAEDLSRAIEQAEIRLESAKIKLEAFRTSGKNSESAINALAQTIIPMEEALAKAGDTTLSASERLNLIREAFSDTATETNTMLGAFESANQVLQRTREYFVDINKTTGPFAEGIKIAETALQAITDGRSVDIGVMQDLEEFFDKFGISDRSAAGVQELVNRMTDLNIKALALSTNLKNIEAAATDIREKGGFDNLISAEVASRDAILGLVSQINAILSESTLKEAERVQLTQQRAELLKRVAESERKETILKLKNSEHVLTSIKNELDVQKQILDTRRQIVQEAENQLSIQRDILRSQLEAQNLGNLRPQDEIRLELLAANDRIRSAKTALEFTKQSVELEFALIEAEYNLLVAKANIDGELTAQEMAVLQATRESINLQRAVAAQRVQSAEAEIKAAEAAKTAAEAAQLGQLGQQGSTSGNLGYFNDLLNSLGEGKLQEIFGQAELSAQVAVIEGMYTQLIETANKLGPEGEVLGAIGQGALDVAAVFASAMESMGDSVQSKLIAGLQIAASAISALGSIQEASSEARISAIDKEIEAEQRRDGKSRESVAKIAALEKKKEAEKKKAFEQNKKRMMAETVINTAGAIMQALGSMPPPASFIFAGIAAAMGAAQLAVIASSSYNGGGSASVDAGPSSLGLGSRNNTIDLATSRNPAGELSYMRGERGYGTASDYTSVGGFTGTPIPRASGGTTGIMVGEQGPELFIPDRPGNIIPADDTDRVGANYNVNFAIHAIDSQGMQDVLMRERGNIIGMLREAANAHGEFFLEQVNIRE